MKLKHLKFVAYFAILMVLSQSCKDKKAKDDENTDQLVDEPVVEVDSNAFTLKKGESHDFGVIKDVEPSSPEDVSKLVDSGDLGALNDYQKFAQEFINACGKKNYEKAAKYLSYMGSDNSRLFKDHFNYANAQEKNIVKTTVDVVFGFLAESNDYKFISSQEINDPKIGKKRVLEITFFKKGIGVNRRFFEIIDTPKGKLIYNMR